LRIGSKLIATPARKGFVKSFFCFLVLVRELAQQLLLQRL